MMCLGCWEAAGSPTEDNERVRTLVAAVDALYRVEGSGGKLHIQLDDWNLEDEYVMGDQFSDAGLQYRETLPIEHAALEALQACSEMERYSAMAIAWKDVDNEY